MQKKSCALSILAAACAAGAAPSAHANLLIYEPFNYTSGQTMPGLVNTLSAAKETWQPVGTSTTVGTVSAGNLASPVGPNIGNSLLLSNLSQPNFDRLSIPFAFNTDLSPKYASGSQLYYSLMLQISNVSGLTVSHTNTAATNDGIISFNDTQGSHGSRPGNYEGELNIRKGSVAGTYNLGIHATTTDTGGTYWTNDITPSTTPMFIVAELQLGIGNTDPGVAANDLNSIWVNPNSSTFGASEGTRPAADGSSDGGNSPTTSQDSMQSIVIGAGIAGGAAPNAMLIDDIRVGNNWSDVTSVFHEPGDANLDGQVNQEDFDILAANFGNTSGVQWGNGDFNGDGTVNALDFNALATNWGFNVNTSGAALPLSASAVPEPSSLLLLMAGASVMLAKRRKAQ